MVLTKIMKFLYVFFLGNTGQKKVHGFGQKYEIFLSLLFR